MTTLLGIAGSLRRGSYNSALLGVVVELAPAPVRIEAASIRGIPLYDGDVETESGIPDAVCVLKERIASADGVLLVTPEYNNGYPGVLKNALDYLLPEYHRKPIAIVTVSAGGFGGLNCLAQLRLVILGMGAFPIPAALPVSRVQEAFDDDGNPQDAAYEQRAQDFIAEVLWFAEAIAAQKFKDQQRQAAT